MAETTTPATAAVRRRGDGKYVVARASDLPDGARIIVEAGGHSIGIFNVEGRLYALLNRCPHMGGELCKGDVIGFVDSDRPGDFRLDAERLFISCPWHAWEYDLETGQSWFNPERTRVRPYAVTVESGETVAGELATGATSAPDGDPDVVDTVLHRVKGPLVAQVVPVEVENEYIVLSLARVTKPE
jgi:nitrite reductase/ring-hydroxylating ferredoxin subunit